MEALLEDGGTELFGIGELFGVLGTELFGLAQLFGGLGTELFGLRESLLSGIRE